MNNIVSYLVLAYFLGAIPTAYLAGKWFGGLDIRQHGSGNVGTTNAFRVLGKGPGSAVFMIDFLKGALPVYLFKASAIGSLAASNLLLCVGLAAVLGHVYTPFLRFKGGKGIATGAGMLASGFPVLFIIVLAVWILTFSITRIVSVSSMGAALALAIAGLGLGYRIETNLIFIGIAVFVLWTHRSNIDRLLKGEEGKKFNKTDT